MSNLAFKEYISKLETLYDTVVKSSSNGYYEGERNSAGQPHGSGTMHYPEGDENGRKKYVGEWKNGKWHGKGKLDLKSGNKYEGDWKENSKHGKGKYEWQDGDIYIGDYHEDVRHGKGKYFWKNGEVYEGQWKEGNMHGKGIKIDSDGLSFEGEWNEDKCIKSTEKMYAGSPSVKIGKQIWMTKNLDVETFRNGDPIPHVTSAEEWEQYGNQGKSAWCYYENSKANGEKYGKLYNWHAVNDPRGLAPEGWHVASIKEWHVLVEYLGGSEEASQRLKQTSGWTSSKKEVQNSKQVEKRNDIIKKIDLLENSKNKKWKEIQSLSSEADQNYGKGPLKRGSPLNHFSKWPKDLENKYFDLMDEWHKLCKQIADQNINMAAIETTFTEYSSGNGTNISGFSGLPGGGRFDGVYYQVGEYGCWWSSTENDTGSAWYWYIQNNLDSNRHTYGKKFGFSVRCLKD